MDDFGDQGHHHRAAPPLNKGDFGDLSDQARILSLNKTNFELNTYPGLRIGDVGDHSTNNTKGSHYQGLPLPLKIGDFGDQDDQARILCLNEINFELNTCP